MPELATAFKLANPFALATRRSGELLDCAIAACSGAAALRELGVEAKPIFCATIAGRPGNFTSVGHTEATARAALAGVATKLGELPLSTEEMGAFEPQHGGAYSHHVIIAATARKEDATFIDPTATQLGTGTGLRLPLTATWVGTLTDGLFLPRDGFVQYGPCEHIEHLDERFLRAEDSSLVRNYVGLMRLALSVGLDVDAFHSAVAAESVDLIRAASAFQAAVLSRFGVEE